MWPLRGGALWFLCHAGWMLRNKHLGGLLLPESALVPFLYVKRMLKPPVAFSS